MKGWSLVIGIVVVSCGGGEVPKTNTVAGEPTPSPPAPSSSVDGRLELWSGGIELGQEVRRDDGQRLTSEVSIGAKVDTITVTRATRTAVFVAGDKATELEVPPDGLPWGSGHVGLAKLALDWYPDAKAKPIRLVSAHGSADAMLTVAAAASGHTVEIAPAKGAPFTITFDAGGAPIHGTTGEAVKPALEARATPDGIIDEAVAVEHDGIVVRGVLWMPKGAVGKLPLLVIHAGSGPTDRDNNQVRVLWTDSFRLLAEALARKQIATLRFDKRFSGQTSPAGRAWSVDDIRGLRVDGYVDDLTAMLRRVRKDSRFGSITLMGHSEGGLVSLLAATKAGAAAPDALIFANSTGRKLSVVLREQLAAQVDAKMLREVDDMMDQLRTNKPVTIPTWLVPSGLVTPDTIDFVRSEIDLDPAELLSKLNIPATVIQGETDVQTGMADANALASKRPDVKVTVLPRTNHMFKEAAERQRNSPTLTDPTLPLAPGVVDAIANGVKR